MDEFIERFAALGVGDPESVVSYVFGILDSSGPDAQLVGEALEPYIDDKNELEAVCTDICNWMKAKDASSAASSSTDKQNNIKDTIRARWTDQPENPPQNIQSNTSKPEHNVGLDKAEREATLRLARQIHDKRMEEEIAEEMANAAVQAEEEGMAARNRAAVQNKVAQAQNARAAAVQKHKAESKQAAKTDKKDKEERKEQRRMKAQKSERRGGF